MAPLLADMMVAPKANGWVAWTGLQWAAPRVMNLALKLAGQWVQRRAAVLVEQTDI